MKQIFAIISIFMLIACQDVNKPEMPEDLIPEETMIGVLTDAYMANAARSINNRIIRREGIKLDTIIYKKYGIDSIRFAKSHAYYTTDLNTYADLFSKVEANLIKIQTHNDTLKARERKRQDSLSKVKQDSIKAQNKDTLTKGRTRERGKPKVNQEELGIPIQDSIE